jgi:hypothetical protein
MKKIGTYHKKDVRVDLSSLSIKITCALQVCYGDFKIIIDLDHHLRDD